MKKWVKYGNRLRCFATQNLLALFFGVDEMSTLCLICCVKISV